MVIGLLHEGETSTSQLAMVKRVPLRKESVKNEVVKIMTIAWECPGEVNRFINRTRDPPAYYSWTT